ncbi:MAG: hypothetical protein GQ525_08215 [Draconibacterium sp.]|nr:hypothetical protein [Draconibacterium sp.]
MKKLLIILFILGISTQLFAEITVKQVVGKWKYTVTMDEGELKGVFNFTEKEGKLTGEIVTEDGYTFAFSKVEIKDENTLYFEFTPEYDLIAITLKIDGEKFKGTGSSNGGEAPITGEKVE